MQRGTLIALLLTIFPLWVMAQSTIKGFLYDKDNGEPVPFANIILQDTKFGTATDINGFFLINKIPKGGVFFSGEIFGLRGL